MIKAVMKLNSAMKADSGIFQEPYGPESEPAGVGYQAMTGKTGLAGSTDGNGSALYNSIILP